MKKSKYQEALIRIRALTDVQVDVDDLYNFVTGSSFEADIEKLQDLVDKETLTKPKKDTEDNVRWKYYCPGCGNRLNSLTKQRRCQGTDYHVPRCDEFGCGQKIDWSKK